MLENIWAILKGDETNLITPQNLKTICGIIQGVISPIAKKTQDKSQSQKPVNSLGTFSEIGNFMLQSKAENK